MNKGKDPKPAAPPPPRATQKGLVVGIGKKVDIFGLQGAPQYNGLEGRVTAGPNEKGRWLVQLIFEGSMKELSLTASNLQPKPQCGWELVAAGLSMSTTEQDVTQVFAGFGAVQSCRVTRDLNGISKGVAMIVMQLRESAEAILALETDLNICGIPAKIQWSTMVKQDMGLLKTRDEETGNTTAATATRRTFHESSKETAPAAETPEEPLPNREALAAMSTKDIRKLLQSKSVEVKDCIERADFLEKALALCPAADVEVQQPEQDRQRKRKWDESNQGGEVYVGNSKPKETATAAEAPEEALPSREALDAMSTKDIRKLLQSRSVEIKDCIERADFLEKARALCPEN